MEINIASVAGSRSSWTQSLFTDYQKRFDSSVKVNLINVSPEKRKNKVNNLSKIIEKEGKKLIEKIPDNSINISFDYKYEDWYLSKLDRLTVYIWDVTNGVKLNGSNLLASNGANIDGAFTQSNITPDITCNSFQLNK